MNAVSEQVAAVILAGGFGTRIRHLLSDIPKPMAPVNGRPFVEWVVRYLLGEGIRRIAISTGHLAHTVQVHFAENPVAGAEIVCIPETEPLGTAGGFLNAIEGSEWEAPAWLVLNGDSLVLAPLAPMLDALRDGQIQGALMGVAVPDATRYGTIEQDAAGMLKTFQEKRPGAGVINAGVYLLSRSAVALIQSARPLSFEKDVFPAMAARGARMKVCVTQAPFLDIGTPESLPLASAFVQQHSEWFRL